MELAIGVAVIAVLAACAVVNVRRDRSGALDAPRGNAGIQRSGKGPDDRFTGP